MRAFEMLELPHGASEKEVKRAYARLLKYNRPDEYPEKFQALNEAYQMALHISRSGVDRREPRLPLPLPPGVVPAPEVVVDEPVNYGVPEVEIIGVPDPFPVPDISRNQEPFIPLRVELEQEVEQGSGQKPGQKPSGYEPFDADVFAQECIHQAQVNSPEALQVWLGQCQEIWSLDLKLVVGQILVWRLGQDKSLLHPRAVNVLVQFFSLDVMLADQDPMWLSYLEGCAKLDWELQEENWRQLALRLQHEGRSFKRWWQSGLELDREWHISHVICLLTQLCRSFSYFQVVLQALIPWRASELRQLILGLDEGEVDRLSPPINPQQVSFWLRAGDSKKFSWLRLQLGLLRGVLALLVSCVLLSVLSWDFEGGLAVSIVAIGTGFGLWLLYITWQGNMGWQRAPETVPTYSRLLRLIWVPLLFLSGAILEILSESTDDMPWDILYIIASIVAISRYAHRNSVPIWVRVWRNGMSSLWTMPITLFCGFFVWILFKEPGFEKVLYAFAFGHWLLDVWKQRFAIHEGFSSGRRSV
ncbi:MAG: J domain-containing protein [Azovibrio sp.]